MTTEHQKTVSLYVVLFNIVGNWFLDVQLFNDTLLLSLHNKCVSIPDLIHR